MDAARTMYHELSPETAEFIDFMQDNELFDVESRPGKMSGGYMTSLPSYKAPSSSPTGTTPPADVDVLTHECGHAFEGYVAERDPNVPADLECPGMESAEIHSMAMEFLTAPWHHLLFGKDTDKYALLHAEDSFLFLAYGCAVDEFQHIMYQNPDLTPDERNADVAEAGKEVPPLDRLRQPALLRPRCGLAASAAHLRVPLLLYRLLPVHHGRPAVLPAEPHRPQGRLGALPATGAPCRSGQLHRAAGDRRPESAV